MVFVDHSADYSVVSDEPGDWWGECLVVVVGGALVPGLVGAMAVVMLCVLGQDLGGVMLVVDQDTVSALGADRAHEPLGITVRLRGCWSPTSWPATAWPTDG